MDSLKTAFNSIVPTAGDNSARRRALRSASIAHAMHDGLTDLISVLLPAWQSQFAISYALVGLLRGSYAGAMAGFQLLANRLAVRWGRKRMLVGGMALAGFAYLMASLASGPFALLAALVLGGLGASTQHPLASAMVSDAYRDGGSKEALSWYNFAGDVGKMVMPGLVGLLLAVASWRAGVLLAGGLGLAAAVVLWVFIPTNTSVAAVKGKESKSAVHPGAGGGLRALLGAGILDSAARTGILTFLPFVLREKGADTVGIGFALSLLFVGGAFGKLFCGYLGTRTKMRNVVWLTEASTSLLIVAVLYLPLHGTMVVLPLLGLVLNGTSSVLYGTVSELVSQDKRQRAFALFYTGTIGSGALSPVLCGWLSDGLGMPKIWISLAVVLLLTLPLAWRVQLALDT